MAQPGGAPGPAGPHRALLGHRLESGWGEGLERGDGVAHGRSEERSAEVAAVAATLGEQCVARRPRVELRHEVHDRLHLRAVGMRGVYPAVAQVLVNVPRPLSAPIGRRGEQLRATIAEPERGEPAAGDELGAPPLPGIEALEHERALPAVASRAQAANIGRDALDAAGTVPGARNELLDRVTHLHRAGLDGVAERAAHGVAQGGRHRRPSGRYGSIRIFWLHGSLETCGLLERMRNLRLPGKTYACEGDAVGSSACSAHSRLTLQSGPPPVAGPCPQRGCAVTCEAPHPRGPV